MTNEETVIELLKDNNAKLLELRTDVTTLLRNDEKKPHILAEIQAGITALIHNEVAKPKAPPPRAQPIRKALHWLASKMPVQT